MTHSKRKQFTIAEAKSTGDRLGVSWELFDIKQFRMGMNAELADGTYDLYTNFSDDDDPIKVGKVVRAHLNESPDYYTKWAQMEKEAEHDHGGKHTKAVAEAVMIEESVQ